MGKKYALQFRVTNSSEESYPGGRLYAKVSYETSSTYESITLVIPRLGPKESKVLPDRPIELTGFSEGIVMLYGILQNAEASRWELLDAAGIPCIQFTGLKQLAATSDFAQLSFEGTAASFGRLFSRAPEPRYVKWTFWATVVIIVLTVIILGKTLLG